MPSQAHIWPGLDLPRGAIGKAAIPGSIILGAVKTIQCALCLTYMQAKMKCLSMLEGPASLLAGSMVRVLTSDAVLPFAWLV